jgi:hypothetical protein
MQEILSPNPLESVFKFIFTPQNVKERYFALANELSKQFGISEEEAAKKIIATEKEHGISLYQISYSSEGTRGLYYLRKILSAKKDLGIASEGEIEKLEQLSGEILEAIQRVCLHTSMEKIDALRMLEDAMRHMNFTSITEAEKLLVEGPETIGFNETGEYNLTDEKVEFFLRENFGLERLLFSRVGRIKKDNYYIVLVPSNASERIRSIIQEFSQRGLLNHSAGNMVIAESKEVYEELALLLEEKVSVDSLEHTYKIRASSGHPYGFSEIDLHSFGIEKPEDFDYLDDLPLSDEEKLRAYILGTVAHEVIHRWEAASGELLAQLHNEHSLIIAEESPENRFVSAYVKKHAKAYGTNDTVLQQEDLAESARIFLTNPHWLKMNHPQRYELIQKHLPFLQEGSCVQYSI